MFTIKKKKVDELAKKAGLINNEALKSAVLSSAQNELGGRKGFLQFGQFGQFGRSVIYIGY